MTKYLGLSALLCEVIHAGMAILHAIEWSAGLGFNLVLSLACAVAPLGFSAGQRLAGNCLSAPETLDQR